MINTCPQPHLQASDGEESVVYGSTRNCFVKQVSCCHVKYGVLGANVEISGSLLKCVLVLTPVSCLQSLREWHLTFTLALTVCVT